MEEIMEIYKNMNKICTDIEQSKKLIELGIDVNTADMYHAPDANVIVAEPYIMKTEDETLVPAYKGAIPAWSLSRLMEFIPKSIVSTPNPLSINYCCRNVEFDIECYADNPVDATFEMVVWLKENNLKEK